MNLLLPCHSILVLQRLSLTGYETGRKSFLMIFLQQRLHQRDFITIRTICWKISRFLSYFSWLQYKQFGLISVQQNMQQKNVIPRKARKEHHIGIFLLCLFWLRKGWSRKLLPVWFWVLCSGEEFSTPSAEAADLSGKLVVCLFRRITSELLLKAAGRSWADGSFSSTELPPKWKTVEEFHSLVLTSCS